ncbi:MAG: hypothetical protein HPY66_3427 [Firmicutes bacterium]|nr:hypothetical protein [Bacillota bacterium]MDI6705418.1 prepilin-type N-terminal cleavage/methylation domain-containing protein [Bacillota bacterium]
MGHRRRGGFTLTELLAVMLILAIAAALARSGFEGLMAGARARAAIREMVTDFRYAQQMAVSEGKNYYVLIDWENNFYRIKTSSHPQPKVIKQVWLEGNVRLTGIKSNDNNFYSRKEFHFCSSGAPSSGITIYLQDYRGKDYSITVLPATGRVRVYY